MISSNQSTVGRTEYFHVAVARVTIELTSPMALGSGETVDLQDSPFVTDASGLPAIPGSSLAGVLRSHWRRQHGDSELFGPEKAAKHGRISEINISWGRIHDSANRPCPGRLSRRDIRNDELLCNAAVPLLRQHVRLTNRGAALDKGLYDENIVAAGHRFTFEISIRSSRSDLQETMDGILSLLGSDIVKLGGKTRSGLGAFKVISVRSRLYDLTRADDMTAYSALPVDLSADYDAAILSEWTTTASGSDQSHETVVASLTLKPRGFWLVGGGEALGIDTYRDDKGANKVPDIVPYREPRVVWHNGKGRLDVEMGEVVVPGTSLKGALRHRMVFHAHRLQGTYADDVSSVMDLCEPECVGMLLGDVRLDGIDSEQRAGCVFFDDIVPDSASKVEESAKRITHIAVDRFTGGTIDGVLYSERPFWGRMLDRPLATKIAIQHTTPEGKAVPTLARRAFHAALTDLVEGRLSLGAGGGRGHGYFEGSLTWSDEAWITQAEAGET